MTYKLELFLVLKKKNIHKHKIIQKLCFFLLFIYIGLTISYTKLTYLAQKLKTLD